MDKQELENIKQQFYTRFSLNDVKQMIVEVYGSDAKGYAEQFDLSESMLVKYKMNILDNVDVIEDKIICDVGCNNAIWPVMCAMHGAKQVIGIEPRGMFVNPVNAYCIKNKLPVIIHQGTHKSAETLIIKNKVNTCVLMSVDDIIDEYENFIYRLANTPVKNIINECSTLEDELLQHHLINSTIVDGNRVGFTVHYESHNSTIRAGLSSTNDVVDTETGFQSQLDETFDISKTRYTRHLRSANYIKYIFESNGFDVVKNRVADYDNTVHKRELIRGHWLTVINS